MLAVRVFSGLEDPYGPFLFPLFRNRLRLAPEYDRDLFGQVAFRLGARGPMQDDLFRAHGVVVGPTVVRVLQDRLAADLDVDLRGIDGPEPARLDGEVA